MKNNIIQHYVMYTTVLVFRNHEDFEAYIKAVPKLKLENIALSESRDSRITVLVETNLPLPTGIITTKTWGGREVVIDISSGSLFMESDDK